MTEGSGGTLMSAAAGRLPGGVTGTVGFLYYEVRGNKSVARYRFLVGHTEIPESTRFIPRLFVVRRGRLTSTQHEGIEARSERVWTESVALNERYKVTIGPYQDDNWMRQLFEPTFIDWLDTEPPHDFSFELSLGSLVCSLERDYPDPSSLHWLCQATAYVAGRIREECLE
jgi:hypothetical protein